MQARPSAHPRLDKRQRGNRTVKEKRPLLQNSSNSPESFASFNSIDVTPELHSAAHSRHWTRPRAAAGRPGPAQISVDGLARPPTPTSPENPAYSRRRSSLCSLPAVAPLGSCSGARPGVAAVLATRMEARRTAVATSNVVNESTACGSCWDRPSAWVGRGNGGPQGHSGCWTSFAVATLDVANESTARGGAGICDGRGSGTGRRRDVFNVEFNTGMRVVK